MIQRLLTPNVINKKTPTFVEDFLWELRGLSRLSKRLARYRLLTQNVLNKKSPTFVEDFDKRGFAPVGDYVPSDADWIILSTYLGGEDVAGNKMKSTAVWFENGDGTNSTGFAGLPGGFRRPVEHSATLM